MAKIWLKIWFKVKENGTKKIKLAKKVAKGKKILVQTLCINKQIYPEQTQALKILVIAFFGFL